MKIDLKVMKDFLLEEDWGVENLNSKRVEWINNNIGEGEVSIKEWLGEINKYWSEWSDDYGDSDFIVEMLEEDYGMDEDEIDEVMCEYWGCESVEEYLEEYK
jgi:hypothetical protein